MTAADYLAAGIGSWLILAVLIASTPHRLRRHQPQPPAEEVNFLPYLPPVPVTPRTPVDALDSLQLEDRFFAIVDAETKWFA